MNLVADRRAYVLDADSGAWFSLAGLPVDEAPADFLCTHQRGCTTIEQTRGEVASSWRIFVPRSEPCELWTLTLHNLADRPRRLHLILCCHTAIPGQHEGTLPAAHTAYDEQLGAIVGSNVVRFGSWYSHETVGRTEDGFFAINAPLTGYDAAKRAFTGTYGSYDRPAALVEGRGCTHSDCEFEAITFALQSTFELAPGASCRVHAVAGAHRDREHIARLQERFFAEGVGGWKHYRHGEAGAGWITGSAGWLVTIVSQGIFGLQPTMQGLRVRPCLPPHWTDCGLTRRFRGATYRMRYRRDKVPAMAIAIDGRCLDGDVLPHERGRTYDVLVCLPGE